MVFGYVIGLLTMWVTMVLLNHAIWWRLWQIEEDDEFEVPWNWRLLVSGFVYMLWLTGNVDEEDDLSARHG
jgi:hypothetical protein